MKYLIISVTFFTALLNLGAAEPPTSEPPKSEPPTSEPPTPKRPILIDPFDPEPSTPEPPVCPPGQQWLECGESCNQDYCQVPEYLVRCVSACLPGCYCECGTCKDFNGNCVPEKQCPRFDNYGYDSICPKPEPVDPVCPGVCGGPNEVFAECASFCGGTCKDFRVPSGIRACIDLCKVGCVCADGYLRHPVTDECVLADSCPTTDEFDYENNVPIKPCTSSESSESKGKLFLSL